MAKPKLTDADWERIWQEKFACEPERNDLTLKSSLSSPLRPKNPYVGFNPARVTIPDKFKYAKRILPKQGDRFNVT